MNSDIVKNTVKRLSTLGYTVTEGDLLSLEFYISKAESDLKDKTNQSKLPQELIYIWIDMAAGAFLTDKKAAGALNDIYDFEAPAKSISEGDASVTFAIADTGTFESQFDAMLAKMVTPDNDIIAAHRRLAW